MPQTRRRITIGLERFSLLYVWGLLILVFGIWEPSLFLTTATLKTVASQQAVTAIVALALLVPMAAGAFDVSVANMMGFALVTVTYFQSAYQINALLAVLITFAIAVIVGAVNGLVVVRFRVNSFIATIGMASVINAMLYYLSNGQQIVTGISPTFVHFGRLRPLQIPVSVLYMLGVAVVIWFVTEHRPIGRKLYATGGNPLAARLSGINTSRIVWGSLITSAVVGAFAGILYASIVGSASLTAGPPYLLPAFAAVFLGSTQIINGRVNVIGTLIAVYTLATGVQGLLLLGVPIWVSDLFNGAALIIAVSLSVARGRQVASGLS